MNEWALDIIKKHLSFLAEFEKGYGTATALLSYGQEFTPSDVSPGWLRKGSKKQCYSNATQNMLHRNDVFYAEGFAISLGDFPIPILHSWLISDKGEVIDPTWSSPQDYLYYGVAFKRSFVEHTIIKNRGRTGILVDPEIARSLFVCPELFEDCVVKIQ